MITKQIVEQIHSFCEEDLLMNIEQLSWSFAWWSTSCMEESLDYIFSIVKSTGQYLTFRLY